MGRKRGTISPSLRWSVFARDGFTCRYCGAQAGQPGVELHADHVVSALDGGDESYDNLATACQKCNGGKGARSLAETPAASDVIARINERARAMQEQTAALNASLEAKQELEQQIVNLKCDAYERSKVSFGRGEMTRMVTLCREFGVDLILEWYQAAFRAGVRPRNAVLYVNGCARNTRQERGTSPPGV